MQNTDELIEKYKNDILKMMKRSYFPYEDDLPTVSESVNAETEKSREDENDLYHEKENSHEMSNSDTEDTPKDSVGSLKVRVFGGNIAFPIETAFVRIIDEFDNVIREGYTNQSGIFDVTDLPVPDKSISESPGNKKGYTGYKIVVSHPRFYTEVFENVPVFSGVESIQDVRMEVGDEKSRIVTVENEPDDLRGRENG